MSVIFQASDNAYSDAEIFAALLSEDQNLLGGVIHAASFIAFAEATARMAYGSLSVADDDATLWVYGFADFEIAEKPSRTFVSYAPAAEYTTRENLAAQLLFNSRRCAACDKRAVKHTGDEDHEYDSGLKLAARRVA